MYGVSAVRILQWVQEAVDRLANHAQNVILVDLPLDPLANVSPGLFLILRSSFFPNSRISLSQALGAAIAVSNGLRNIASQEQVALCSPKLEWYGVDPIHIRHRYRDRAWSRILAAGLCYPAV
jgi:hypothetical protein